MRQRNYGRPREERGGRGRGRKSCWRPASEHRRCVVVGVWSTVALCSQPPAELSHKRVFIIGGGSAAGSRNTSHPVLFGGAPQGGSKVTSSIPCRGRRKSGIFQYNFFLKLSRRIQVQRKCFQDLHLLAPPGNTATLE